MNKDTPILQTINKEGRLVSYPLTRDETTIGRGSSCDIVLADHRVSRRHTRINGNQGSFILTDLGSFNGTKVNQKQVQSIELQHNDHIEIGPITLTFLNRLAPPTTANKDLVITEEGEYGHWSRQAIDTKPEEHPSATELSICDQSKPRFETGPLAPFATDNINTGEAIAQLERMNKVLYVLYEISRELTSIPDFNKLLARIMDHIFSVIDADFGFLLLAGDSPEEDFKPVVIKYRDEETKAPITASRTMIRQVIQDEVALLTTNAMKDSRLAEAQSIMDQRIRSAMCVPLWQNEKIIGVIQLDSNRQDNRFTREDLELLKTIGCQVSVVLEQASLNEKVRHEEVLRSRLERFHSPQVIEMIISSGAHTHDDLMEANEKNVTILFSDIVGFTGMAEKMTPGEVNTLLNKYFSRMTDIVFAHEGTLDKYLGDGIMAVFGAPLEMQDHAERAITTALEMRKTLAAIKEEGLLAQKFNIRIGINSGRVVASNIGSPRRLEYTVLGDPVNIASRLETNAQPNQILIGQETFLLVKDRFNLNQVGQKTLKGHTAQIMTYEVLD